MHYLKAGAAITLTLLGIAANSPSLAAQRADSLQLRETVFELASPALLGRRSGSPGNAGARAYLIERLKALDLPSAPGEPAYRSQEFAISGERLVSSTARLVGPGKRELTLSLNVGSPLERRTGKRLRFWRDDEPAPICSEGEILVHHGPLPEGLFLPSLLRDEAAAAGASGLILVPHPDDKRGRYKRYLDRSRGRDTRLYSLAGDSWDEIFMAYVEPDEARKLYIGDALIETGWRVELPDGEPLAHTGVNLFGTISPGEDGVLLLVAHYDHLGETGSGHYPGADDNASGVAVLLELTRLLRESYPGNKELRLLLTDAEEMGLLGAEAYLREFPAPNRVLNLDSVGRAGVDHYTKLADPDGASERLLIVWSSPGALADGGHAELSQTLSDAGFNAVVGADYMFARGGDHHAFAKREIPSSFLFGGFHLDYNTPQDLPERILTGRLARLTDALCLWIADLD